MYPRPIHATWTQGHQTHCFHTRITHISYLLSLPVTTPHPWDHMPFIFTIHSSFPALPICDPLTCSPPPTYFLNRQTTSKAVLKRRRRRRNASSIIKAPVQPYPNFFLYCFLTWKLLHPCIGEDALQTEECNWKQWLAIHQISLHDWGTFAYLFKTWDAITYEFWSDSSRTLHLHACPFWTL